MKSRNNKFPTPSHTNIHPIFCSVYQPKPPRLCRHFAKSGNSVRWALYCRPDRKYCLSRQIICLSFINIFNVSINFSWDLYSNVSFRLKATQTNAMIMNTPMQRLGSKKGNLSNSTPRFTKCLLGSAKNPPMRDPKNIPQVQERLSRAKAMALLAGLQTALIIVLLMPSIPTNIPIHSLISKAIQMFQLSPKTILKIVAIPKHIYITVFLPIYSAKWLQNGVSRIIEKNREESSKPV